MDAMTNGARAAGEGSAPDACEACGGELGDAGRFCPFCGAERVFDLEGELTVADILQGGPTEDATDRVEMVVEADPAHAIDDTDSSDGAGPTTSRRRRTVVLACVVVIALVAGAVAVLARDGAPGYDLDAALAGAHEDVVVVVEDAGRAGTLGQLTAAGEQAESTARSLEAVRGDLELVGNRDDRMAAAAAVDSYLAVLGELALLADLDPKHVATWPSVSEAVDDVVADLRSADAALADRDLPVAEDLADEVESAGGKVGVALEGISAKLVGWAAEVEQISADKTAQSDALGGYVMAFRSQIDKYAGLRNEMSGFSDRILYDSMLFSEAYAFLGGAVTQRQEVHQAMSAAQPPTALVAVHSSVIAAVNESIGAVQSAVRGIEQYQFDYYYTIESTPGWSEFSRTSDQITETYSAAVSNWDLAVETEKQRIAAIKTPARPAV
jgi:hypothetical protein